MHPMNFNQLISEWYNLNKRDLPWRRSKDPYKIWVSEIILQQTRVDQGHDYYVRFLERFPDVAALAGAGEEDVLSVWKGLGYYSRARNMHSTAKYVVENLSGVFPSDHATLLKLKGIGSYTAAAISSICANEPNPVVDGNVVRVISRLYGFMEPAGSLQSQKLIYAKAGELISRENPGDFNQAVMEFGATWCKPANPLCGECIFRQDCYAYKNNLVDKLPLKKKELVRRNRFFNYLYIPVRDKGVVVYKRSGNDIWQNLWELPNQESTTTLSATEITKTELWQKIIGNVQAKVLKTIDYKHILTHRLIHARFFILAVEPSTLSIPDDELWKVDKPLESGLPVARLTERFLQKMGISV
jgi:A/G-specific adenine glycosylase